jgi:serine protease
MVFVSTPTLPVGRSAAARERWRRLRGRSLQVLDRVAERNQLQVETQTPEIGMLVVDLAGAGTGALRRRLSADPKVEAVYPDLAAQLRYQPNDFAFNHPDVHAPNGDFGQWNLLRSGGVRAWDLSKGGGGEVTVIDTGAYLAHPDLSGRIVGTGGSVTDFVGHGTHVAGLVCADSDNGFGIASLGFDCGLFIEKAETCSEISSALTRTGNRSSDVASISLGGCPRGSLNSGLNYAVSRGVVLVVAGDNEPVPDGSCFPAPGNNCVDPAEWVQPPGTGPQVGFDRGLVVTAAKYDGTRAAFAQMTTGVSLASFGAATNSASGGQQGILSTFPATGTDFESGRTTVNGDSRFGYLVGTSMATPQVSGVAALMRAVKPSISAARVVHLIKQTASQCGAYGNGIGWGVIRADEAVEAALDQDLDPPSSRVKSAKRARRAGLAAAAAARQRILNLRLKRTDPPGTNCAAKPKSSGVRKVIVFASANGGRYHRIGKTKKKRLRFQAKRRRHYRFYSIAVDKAGNREAPPATPDAER